MNIFKQKHIVFILVIAFVLLSVCSMTSPLFPIHNKVDQNCFLTVGKGILNGQVPYRDLFEHKGPIIYFMHAFAALISSTSFIGVFFIQYGFLVIMMIYMRRIACFFVKSDYCNLIVLLTTSLMLTTHCYLRGDNAEEYIIVLMTISIFYTLEQSINRNGKPIQKYVLLLNGLFIGFTLWFKFNLLGFWIGWVLFTFIPMLRKKQYKLIVQSILLVSVGVILVTIPCIIYFGINNALYDLFYTYFYCNIFLYTNDLNFFTKFYLLVESIFKNFGQNPIFVPVTALGLWAFFFTNNYIKDKQCRFNLIISFVFLYLGVYFPGVWYGYYALITASFTIFGIIVILDYILIKHTSILDYCKPFLIRQKNLFVVITAFTLLLSLLFSNCLPYLTKSKLDYPQYKFAAIINKTENATLLNYNFIDGGFYLAANIQPQNRFFHKVNIPKESLPEMYEEQLNMIKNKSTDFVVARLIIEKKTLFPIAIRHQASPISPELYENYEVVSTADDTYEGYRFILFKRK